MQFGHLSEAGGTRKFEGKGVAVCHHRLNHTLNRIFNIGNRFSVSFALGSATRKKRTISIITADYFNE